MPSPENNEQQAFDALSQEVDAIISEVSLGFKWEAEVEASFESAGFTKERMMKIKERNTMKERTNARDSWKGMQESTLWKYLLQRKTLITAKQKLGAQKTPEWNSKVDEVIAKRTRDIETEATEVLQPLGEIGKNGFKNYEIPWTADEYTRILNRAIDKNKLQTPQDVEKEKQHLQNILNEIRHYDALLKVAKLVITKEKSPDEHALLLQHLDTYARLVPAAKEIEARATKQLDAQLKDLDTMDQQEGLRRATEAIDRM